MNMLELTTSFFLGIISSILASYLWQKMEILKKGKHKLDIEGSYIEFVKDSTDRQFTFAKFFFDKTRGMFVFDGTNYKNNGDIFCHFETISSFIDLEQRKFFYLFRAQVDGEYDKSYYGFGVINLGLENKKLIAVDGHYVSASVDGRAMSHSMQRITNIQYSRGMRGDSVILLTKK